MAVSHYVCYRVLNKFLRYRAYVGVVTPVDALQISEGTKLPPEYHDAFVTEERLRAYVDDPRNDLSPSFLADFKKRGDLCHGVFEDGDLVSYSFYSRRPTPIDEEFCMHFDERFVYVYKSFTIREHRGRQLHSICMSRVLRTLHREEGCAGLIAHVESVNYRSLGSGASMGHREFGVVRHLDWLGERREWHSRGCDEFGFRITARSEQTPEISRS